MADQITYDDFAVDTNGNLLADQLVTAVIAVADAAGGATTAALTLQLNQTDEATAISKTAQVLIVTQDTQYAPGQALNGGVTFGSATAGSIVASGTGWALVETNATGAFACTATNATDETVYFSARTADFGCSDPTDGVLVVASNSDAAVWSA